MEAGTRVGRLKLLSLFCFHTPLALVSTCDNVSNIIQSNKRCVAANLRTAKLEGRFEIQPHLEEHALHWKVGESPQAGRPKTNAPRAGRGLGVVKQCLLEGEILRITAIVLSIAAKVGCE